LFRKIRYFGFLSPRYKKESIRIIRELAENNTANFTVAEKEIVEAVISSYSPEFFYNPYKNVLAFF